MTKKEQVFEKINSFLDSLFKSEQPIEETTVLEEVKPEEIVEPAAPKVGDPIPDGVYKIGDMEVKVKAGVIEEIMEPKVEEPKEEMKSETPEVKASTEVIEEVKPITLNVEEIKAQITAELKADFDAKLEKISEANRASGIIQAPIETPDTPQRLLTNKEIALNNIRK